MDGDNALGTPFVPDPLAATTLIELFARRVARSGTSAAFLYHKNGQVVTVDWQTLAADVGRTAAALANLGVQAGDRVAQISENRYEWLVFDLAIQMVRAVHVPLHASLTGGQLAFQIADCAARVVTVSTTEQFDKLVPLVKQLPGGIEWILYDLPPTGDGSPSVHRWADLITRVADVDVDRVRQESAAAVKPGDLATILYTSGTTGDPKGVMLTHANLVSNALGVLAANDHREDDLRLSFLPWSHIYARTCDLYTWIGGGCRLAIAESRGSILDDCAKFQPTLLSGVPYFYEKLCRGLIEKSADRTPGSLKSLLGGRIRMCGSGGAALPSYVEQLFHQQEVPLLQGYGLTETSPVISLCTMAFMRLGTVGRPLPDVEVRIAEDGEILTRGPHLMRGYYNNNQATAAAIRDGWFHTGDLGTLDDDGFLTITGRKKDMIVLSTGKNVSPVNIELRLTSLPLVLQAMVIGDDRRHLIALIVPNPDVLRAEIKNRRIRVLSRQAALKHPEVMAMYREAIADCLQDLASYEQIVKFHLLDRGFTQENGELTPTLKLRRDIIQQHLADIVASLYTE